MDFVYIQRITCISIYSLTVVHLRMTLANLAPAQKLVPVYVRHEIGGEVSRVQLLLWSAAASRVYTRRDEFVCFSPPNNFLRNISAA